MAFEYNNKLIIGGNGFIGRNLIKYISESEVDFTIYILTRKVDYVSVKSNKIQYIIGDYTDVEFLDDIFKKHRFNSVFHFASASIPVSSNSNIRDDVDNNLMPIINLLEVMKIYGCGFILYLSSGGAVYGEFQNEVLKETHICQPISSYGVIKLTIENYIQLYYKQHNISYLILRISNPYGPYHHSNKQGVINISLRNAINSVPLNVWGDGEQAKDYVFVEDIAYIICELLKKNVKNQIFNVGSGYTFSLNNIIALIKQRIPTFQVSYESAKSADVKSVCLDIDKLKKYIYFIPTPIEIGINKTLEWEKEHLNSL